MKYFLLTIFIALIFSPSLILAQNQGKTFTQNYPPKVYEGQAQNWSLVQDHRGVIYIGNGGGAMEYDGSNWRITPLPNLVTVRSLAIADNKVVYVGSSSGFGYLNLDKNGNTTYQSLDRLLPDSIRSKITDIWETEALGNTILFRSTYYLFRYQNGKIDYWQPANGNRFFSGFTFNNKYHLYETDKPNRRIKALEGDRLVTVSAFDQFPQRSVFINIPYKKDTVILGGSRGNFYKYPFSDNYKKDSLTIFKNINETLSKSRVSTNAMPFEGGYAFGSNSKGVLVFDEDLQFQRYINEENNNLISNQIYAAMVDKDGALWCATGNGISKVDLSSEVTYWDKTTGLKGTVYHLESFKDQLYINTSLSVYTLKNSKIIKLKNAPETQCWHLMKFKDPEKNGEEKLLLSTAIIREIKGDECNIVLTPTYTTGVIFYMLQDVTNPKRVWLATSRGIGSMLYDKGKWTIEPRIPGLTESCRNIAHDGQGGLWVGTYRDGVFRYKKTNGGERDFEIEQFTEEQGLGSQANPILGEINGERVVGTSFGLQTYDAKQNRFVAYTKLGAEFSNGSKDAYRYQEDYKGNVWISGEFLVNHPVDVALKDETGYMTINSPFKKVPPMGVEALHVDKNGTAWLGGSEGLFRYKEQFKAKSDNNYHAIIRKVIIGKDSTLFGGSYAEEINDSVRVAVLSSNQKKIPVIPAEMHSIDFYFTSPFFDNEDETQYKYYLEGFDDDWSDWTKRHDKEYTNLWGKTYTFHVKARNLYGVESTVSSFKFEILNPWYLRIWAFALYVILAFLLVSAAIKWNAKRLEKENERLEGVVEERTKEIRAQTERLTLQNVELNQQKEEIQAQAENLIFLNEEISAVNDNLSLKTEELETANRNIENLTSIGQVITSTLQLREVTRIVYENVNNIMDAAGFGIGVYRPSENILDFRGYMEKGNVLPDHKESVTQTAETIAVKVFNSGEIYFSNSLKQDLEDQGQKLDVLQGEMPLSLIYMPLAYQGQKVGVITVQSFQENAYTEEHLELIKGLGSYVSIALANARGYDIIRAKNKAIKDSIRYSQTIQQSFLPSQKQLIDYLGDHFLLYQPKDIVSGDFYWFAHSPEQNKTFVAVVDCTGHGVPGSFVSIVGATILNEIVNLYKIYEPAEILEKLNTEVVHTLHQKGSTTNDDGMDVCLCSIEKTENGESKITFSGAKRDLYFIRKASDDLEILKGDRKSIGGLQLKEKFFTNQSITLAEGDMLYLASDGFADQHNTERKKIGTLAFRQMLIDISNLPTEEQKEKLQSIFAAYKGDIEQRDDVTILGIRF